MTFRDLFTCNNDWRVHTRIAVYVENQLMGLMEWSDMVSHDYEKMKVDCFDVYSVHLTAGDKKVKS